MTQRLSLGRPLSPRRLRLSAYPLCLGSSLADAISLSRIFARYAVIAAIAIVLPLESSDVSAWTRGSFLRANAFGDVKLAWDPNPSSDNVTRYLVGYRTAVAAETVVDAGNVTLFTVTALAPGQTYFFRVYAENACCRSFPSNEVSDAIPPDAPDTTAPAAPSSLTGAAASLSQINLSWTAATDNVAVTAYRIFRDTLLAAEVPATQTTYSDVGLKPGTQYSYVVVAKDAAGNLSTDSPLALVSTLGDTTPPSMPGSLTGVATTTSIALTWTGSTDNLGVVGYRLTRNGQPVSVTSALTYTDASLAPGTSYAYALVALDAAGNASPPATLTIATLAQPAPCVANGKPYSITIAVQSWSKQVALGARGRVDLTLANSFPVTLLQVKLGTQVVGEIPASDLRDVLAIGFSVPRTAGTYNLFVSATDKSGCMTTTTVVRPLVVQ